MNPYNTSSICTVIIIVFKIKPMLSIFSYEFLELISVMPLNIFSNNILLTFGKRIFVENAYSN